jgi:hypothetical protein
MSVAPDYAAPLIGWRAWAAVDDEHGLALGSVVYATRWPPRERLEAVCVHRPRFGLLARLLRIDPHEAPEEGCECGIYAARTPDLTLLYLDRHALLRWAGAAVIGRVALWGRVIECERGWRGAFAYPTHVFVMRAALSRRQGPDARALAGQLAVYGVPVDVLEARTMAGLLAELAAQEGALSGAP